MTARRPIVIVAGDTRELPVGDTVIGGGSATVSTAAVAFTDGDTSRRVTVTDAAVSGSSRIVCSVRRSVASEAVDVGLLYVANVVLLAAGSFDVVLACVDIGGRDPLPLKPNETVNLDYVVG